MPRFHHKFTPQGFSPAGNTVELSTREIEDAGLLEILQTPGAPLGTWAVLDALLVPGNDWFVFHSPLGLSREVKTALSGLFGRFVARAYAMRYLGYSHFQPIHSPPMSLTGTGGKIHRYPANGTGDLPDWAAWKPNGDLAIIEAKGCNAASGLGTVLNRAYTQSKRATIRHGKKRATFKRFAIATRWGVDTIGSQPLLWVKDPIAEGDLTEEAQKALGMGLVRRHYASLMAGLGFDELSTALIGLTRASLDEQLAAQDRASEALANAPARNMRSDRGAEPQGELVGSLLTRSGPLRPSETLTDGDLATLKRLSIQPVFVGVEVENLRAAIDGTLPNFSARLPTEVALREGAVPTIDASGAWIGRLEEDRVRISDPRLLT